MKQLLILITLFFSVVGQAQSDKENVLEVVNAFFETMEKQDSVGFNNLFIENAYAYSIRKQKDSSIVGSSILKAISTKDKLKELLRENEITIQVNGNVAAVSAPYDFWINGVHSHCGFEVFTFLKNQGDWKIASLTYSVEKGSCNE